VEAILLIRLVGARIHLLHKRRKMGPSELGKALGVSFLQMQKYESGKNRVGASRLHFVATALNVPVTELIDGAAVTGGAATKLPTFDPQALRLAEAFVKISARQLRTSLVDLVEAMAMKIRSAQLTERASTVRPMCGAYSDRCSR
jgi:transcriptional regulator with XRE-family HTH domain